LRRTSKLRSATNDLQLIDDGWPHLLKNEGMLSGLGFHARTDPFDLMRIMPATQESLMPRYYIDVDSSQGFTKDEVGSECVDAETARQEARLAALRYASHQLQKFQPVGRHTLIIRDEAGAEVGRCDPREIIHEVVLNTLEASARA
jgi:hypothetical protein